MDAGSLDAFYRATTFMVYHPDAGEIPVRVGRHHPSLDELVRPLGSCWAFLTAYNPRSVVLPDLENGARMEAMRRDVADAGNPFWPGAGISDRTDWKPEISILAIGMGRDAAELLSERYEQNAYVYGEIGGTAELVWTKSARAAGQ